MSHDSIANRAPSDDTPDADRSSRRAFLTTAGVTLGSGALVALAGCLETRSAQIDQQPPRSATPTPTTSTPPAFRQWLPDPTSTPLRDGYGVVYFDLAGIRPHQEAIHANAYDRLSTRMRSRIPTDFVDSATVETTMDIGFSASLALGSFDPAAFGEQLTSTDRTSETAGHDTPTTPTRTPWPEPDHYQGFDIYGTESVYAVSEDALLHVAPVGENDNGVETAKAIIDAPTAQTGQYTESNEYVAAMLDTLADPDAVWCYPEAMDGSSSRGFRDDTITGGLKAWRFGSQTTHLTFANTYPDAETATRNKLTDYIESNPDRFAPYDGLDVETKGRLVWTTGTIPTPQFDFLSPGGPADSVTTPN